MSTLDRLVAEKVMGWPVSTDPACKSPTMYLEGDMLWHAGGCVVWSPSTDMNAAMEAVNAAKSRHAIGGFSLHRMDNGEWRAEFYGWTPDGARERRWRDQDACHANPATAICLAALATVGVEYKESKDE